MKEHMWEVLMDQVWKQSSPLLHVFHSLELGHIARKLGNKVYLCVQEEKKNDVGEWLAVLAIKT